MTVRSSTPRIETCPLRFASDIDRPVRLTADRQPNGDERLAPYVILTCGLFRIVTCLGRWSARRDSRGTHALGEWQLDPPAVSLCMRMDAVPGEKHRTGHASTGHQSARLSNGGDCSVANSEDNKPVSQQ